jgi:hypothetical protein
VGVARWGFVKKEWKSSGPSWRSWVSGVLLLWWVTELIVEINGRAMAMAMFVAVIMVTVSVFMARVAVMMRVGRLVAVRGDMSQHSCCRR